LLATVLKQREDANRDIEQAKQRLNQDFQAERAELLVQNRSMRELLRSGGGKSEGGGGDKLQEAKGELRRATEAYNTETRTLSKAIVQLKQQVHVLQSENHEAVNREEELTAKLAHLEATLAEAEVYPHTYL
jgi:predicted RNase H-like nuclease (RuvC/YqgF family)